VLGVKSVFACLPLKPFNAETAEIAELKRDRWALRKSDKTKIETLGRILAVAGLLGLVGVAGRRWGAAKKRKNQYTFSRRVSAPRGD
jgi:hypothetical protein